MRQKALSGFRPSHSATTECLKLQSVLDMGLDEGKLVADYVIDLLVAFDFHRGDTVVDQLKESANISEGLMFIIIDFLLYICFQVEIEGVRLVSVGLPIGRVQR